MEHNKIYELSDHRRLVNWWMRFEDLNWPSQHNYDRIKMRAEKLAEANVTTAILFGAHFRWDYLPYFTLLHDHIAAIAEELHKYNIELFDRHSVNLIHRYDTREEMRHVMLHSGPHLPFSPSREAAASWEFKGKRLNDWRMIDVTTGQPLYYPQYASEGFCYNNPDFIDAYSEYAKKLVADTGIDGLAAEDTVHYMHFTSCGCPHCRNELIQRAGINLPPADDRSFWGNWENPAWKTWIDLRYDASRKFLEKLSAALPKDFPITTCGQNSSSTTMNGLACDARIFATNSNYIHCEWSGNTPPYAHDPVTANYPISARLSGSSHHLAVAKEKGLRCFTTGYGFTEPTANIIWALNKLQDQDCCFSTLKARLGLPQDILDSLPNEYDVVGKAYTFEKNHPELFVTNPIGQLGIYFSYETRNHTFFGNLSRGYSADYSKTLRLLMEEGISAETVFSFPETAKEYPVILVPSPAAMTQAEKDALKKYLAAGGKVIITGPCALECCQSSWKLPTHPELAAPEDFFDTIANGVWHKSAAWITDTRLTPTDDPDCWQEPMEGLYYHPGRVRNRTVCPQMLELCRKFCKQLPVTVTQSEGFFVSTAENETGYVVQLLAENYDTDIDHHLDEIRFHRSRVNFINKVTPIQISRQIRVKSQSAPAVYTPFLDASAMVTQDGDEFIITLPEDTAYVILHFPR